METPLSSNVTVYRPCGRLGTGFGAACGTTVRSVLAHRELIAQLVRRDLLSEFKGSFVGPLWLALAPVAASLSWLFLHRARLLAPGDTGIPYPAFVLTGTTFWGVFTGVFSSGSMALTGSWHLLQHVRFPHEVLFISRAVVRYVNFLLSFLCSLLLMALLGVRVSPLALVAPILVLPLVLYGVALGMMVAVPAVLSYDFRRIVSRGIGLVLFVTPVAYTPDALARTPFRSLITFNPLAHQIVGLRDIVLTGSLTEPLGFWLSAAASVVVFLGAWRLFYLTEERVMERIP